MDSTPPAESRPNPRARAAPYLVLAVMLALTAAVAYYVRAAARAQNRLRFENAVQRTEDDIRARLGAYLAMLRAGTGMFASHPEVSTEEFEVFVRRLDLGREYPGIQGVGFARRARSGEVESVVAGARARGLADYRVWPEGARADFFPILFLEPRDERNRAALGYDMYSEPVRREAMRRAADTGQPAASGRVELVQEIDPSNVQAGFLIYVPVYRGAVEPETVEARWESLAGFVYSPFRADDLLVGIFGYEPNPIVDFAVYDGEAQSPAGLLHRSDRARGGASAKNFEPTFAETRAFRVAGRTWTIHYFTRPDFDPGPSHRLVPFIAAGGAFLSLLFFFGSRAQARARAEAERAAAALLDSETRFRTVVEQSPVSIQIFAPDGRTIRVNRAWEELWGVSREVLGDYNVLEDPQLEEKGAAPYIRRGFAGEVAAVPPILYDPEQTIPGLSRNEDPRRWVGAVIYPVRDTEGRVREVVLMHEDITERKEAEQERERLLLREQQLRTEAETANRLKDEFLATLSHELRTPLTSVLGWAKLLRSEQLDQKTTARAVEAIVRNAEAQTRLVNDLLDVSRIVTGKLRLQVSPVGLASVVEAAAEGVRPAAQARGVRLSVSLDPRADEVAGDADRLQQVVWNLLSNAVKFTPGGGQVEVTLARSDGHAEIRVSDTGQGIAREFLPHVFDRFRQADQQITREHGGLGLGLSIARHLVELHGGTIRAESEGPGRGSTFVVNLPLSSPPPGALTGDGHAPAAGAQSAAPRPWPAPSPAPSPATGPLAGLSVLLAEDDEDSLAFLSAVLERAGARVARARSTREGFEKLKLLRPDLLVSDIGMAGADGYEFIRRVRALPAAEGGETPAAALTAYARPEDREEAARAGFQEHIPKPVEPAALVSRLARLAGREPEEK
ncbi:MAG TPA: CHASE domain-containing protein [Pyrinomonadaceae bacterium]|nr:CHASE domain-containing protein [Pyrinomonadaceae bacterium]